ncbi:MAG: DNA-processing protein DprA [Candidatus Shapirobacteria bacterium]
MSKDLPYYLAFNFFGKIDPSRFKVLLDYFGSAKRLWEATRAELKSTGLSGRLINDFLEFQSIFDPQKVNFTKENWNIPYDNFSWYKEIKDYQKCLAGKITILTWQDKHYPKVLKNIINPPPVLYVKGKLPSSKKALAVIGSRSASVYGRQNTQKFVQDLVKNKITIISGLARGIDAIAHQTALDNNGQTIAVLGSGINVAYPYQNKNIYLKIINGGGAVISEFPPFYPPYAPNFIQRNRIISGLSKAVLVVEAGKRSGSLVTARLAGEQGREVMAIPGPINSPLSAGTSYLLSQGAKLVTKVEDILEEL